MIVCFAFLFSFQRRLKHRLEVSVELALMKTSRVKNVLRYAMNNSNFISTLSPVEGQLVFTFLAKLLMPIMQ